MKKILKSLKPYLIWLLPVLLLMVLVYFFIDKIKSAFQSVFGLDDSPKSVDVKTSQLIEIIDNALDKWGTFNKDHVVIFDALKDLNKQEIVRLYKDFGFRYYNPIFRMYGVTNVGSVGISTRKDLNALFDSEFDDSQKLDLKTKFNQVGLAFPYLTD